jgi:hypothetical protein
MKSLMLAFAVVLALMAPPASAAWGYALDAQAQKGQGRGPDSGARGRDSGAGRHAQRDDRRSDQLNDEERRALHRDLDKANRELYKRRSR